MKPPTAPGAETSRPSTFTPEQLDSLIKVAFEAGQKDERTRVVAWLRREHGYAKHVRRTLAGQIERGAHVAAEPAREKS